MSIFYFTITAFEFIFFVFFLPSLSYFMFSLCVPRVIASISMTFIFYRVSMFWFCYQESELRSSQAMQYIRKVQRELTTFELVEVLGPHLSFCTVISLKVQLRCNWKIMMRPKQQ